ncbi:MAG: macro domain-containing protein [Oscillospiraceae bacterium]
MTPAFNLPCRYVLHTVGPIIDGRVTKRAKNCWSPATAPAWSCSGK